MSLKRILALSLSLSLSLSNDLNSRETKSIIVNVIGDSGIDKLISLLRDQSAADLQRSAAILLASLAGNGTPVRARELGW